MSIQIDDLAKTGHSYPCQLETILTTREKRIVTMLKEGKTVKEIAQAIHLPFPEAQKLIYFVQSKVRRMQQPTHR